MAKPEITEEENLNNKKISPEGESKDLQNGLFEEVVQGGVDVLKEEVQEASYEGGEEPYKGKEKKPSNEEIEESAKIEELYNTSLLRIQEAFNPPVLEEGQLLSIKGEDKEMVLGKHILEIKVLGDNNGRSTETRHLLKKGELWKGNTFRHTENMEDAIYNPPFDAENFVKDLDEFIKNADQCKVEVHIRKNSRKKSDFDWRNIKDRIEGGFGEERKRKLNDVYKYIITNEDGKIELDKERLEDGKIKIGDTEYPELGEGQTGLGYKIEDDMIVIGEFDENGKTSGETIIVGKDGNLMIGMTENGEKKGSWIIQIKNTTIVDVDENGKERIVKNNETLSNSKYGEFFTREKDLKDGDEINISSHEDLKKYTKDKKILAIYDERYFREKTLSLKYFDNSNKVHRIKKAEKVGDDKIEVTYTEGLEKSSITGKDGNNISDGLCLFIETNKSEKVNRVKEGEGKDGEEKLREERKRKLNDVYKYIITNEDGKMELDKERLEDGKIKIGDTEYPELGEGQTGLGYKIEDDRIIIGNFDNEGKTSGETIIVGKDGNLMIGEMEKGERKGEWLKQSTISIITISGDREDAQIDEEEKKETLENSQYGKFDSSTLLGFDHEIEIKSKDQLKMYVKDQDVFNEMSIKYNDEYFETKSLSLKGVASPKSEREFCEIKKAEKAGNKVDVTYETNVYTGIKPSIAGTGLFVEINKGDEVTRTRSKEESGEAEDGKNEISEETMERINLLKEYTIFEDGLIGLDKEKLQDNKLKIGEIEYSERTKGNEGNFYEIIESRSVSKEGKEYTMGTKLIVGEYDKDGNPKGEMITIDSNGIITVGKILPESLPRSS